VTCLDELTSAAFSVGRLPRAEREKAIAHLVTCDSCRRRVILGLPALVGAPDETGTVEGSFAAQPREGSDPSAAAEVDLPRGTIVGRYTILELVGRGGVGEVYAAYDPKLDRRVALKLLRIERIGPGDAGEARLLREAQAIAKVSHPNVVTVHDVGTHGDRVFIAMEYVAGATIKDWLAATPRSRAEILDVFKGAARGLAAAHAAGLVHRDFKPQNVMVGRDGGARVMDFGLVRQMDDGHESTFRPSGDALPAATDLDGSIELTRTGDLVGTPRYMAPEQFRAEPADARTDQYSFCVALYEALYGQRPYDGETLPTLVANVLAGHLPPAPKAGVPSWLRRVVVRGLSVEPAQRFPSMQALLTALEDDPSMRRRRLALVLGVSAATLVATAGVRHFTSAPVVDCGGGLDRWAPAWSPGADDARRRAIRAAFAATGKSYAAQAFTRAASALDEYANAWIGVYRDACVAHARGEQSSEVLDLRMSCLQERLTSAAALTDLFARADGDVVENAASAAGSLPRLERCSNVPLLKAVVPPPEGEAQRKHVAELRAEVARVAALGFAGHCAEAEKLADDLLARVRAAGYQPLLADALNVAGHLGDQCADVATTIRRFESAYVAGLASRHDEAAARAAIEAAGFYTDRAHELQKGRTWLDIAHATLQRLGSQPLLEAWLENGEGIQAMAEGRAATAVPLYTHATESRARILGAEHPETIIAHTNVATALDQAGRSADALPAFEETVALASRVLGAEHPVVALALSNEGEALDHLQRYGEALAKFERATSTWRAAGSDPMFISFSLTGAGLSLLGLGRPLDAIAPLEEALRTRVEKNIGADRIAETRLLLARALWARPADRARAKELAKQTRDELTAAGAKDAAAAAETWLAAPTSSL
jgi:tetratricopeptide (TPR) repeat protein